VELDCYERSLLHYAAMGNCTNLLLFLLQSNPNIDSRDHWGRTPLS
jgi:ankyrin repeat protein